jgi:6-phosphogluconolactonase (cycloisomerase 2 family)
MPIYVASHGSGSVRVLADTGAVGEPAPAPGAMFLAAHPHAPTIYAAGDTSAGRLDGDPPGDPPRDPDADPDADPKGGAIFAFATGPDGALRPLPGPPARARQPSGGAVPIHLAVSADGRYLLCANWGDGSVAVLPLDPDGGLGAPVDVVRYGKPHAHHVSLDRDLGGDLDRDLGGDLAGDRVTVVHYADCRLYGYRLEPPGRLVADWSADAGRTGPRHLVAHPSGRRYVADEHSSTLSTYEPDPATGGLKRIDSRPATLEPPAGPNHPSELAVSADGRWLYLANRGNDTIATFAVDTGLPVPVSEVPTGGAFPIHFALAGPLMYVANQHSDSVTVLRLTDGPPEPTGRAFAVPGPTCVLPAGR